MLLTPNQDCVRHSSPHEHAEECAAAAQRDRRASSEDGRDEASEGGAQQVRPRVANAIYEASLTELWVG